MKETINKIWEKAKKFTYIYEFIISVLMAVNVSILCITKNVHGYWDKWTLLWSIITVLLTVAIMIYHIMRDRKQIAKMFLNFVIPIGLLFWAFMIPGQVPDETAHMIKAYEVSNGILHTKVNEQGESKTIVPEELLEYNHNQMNTYSKLEEQFQKDTDYSKTTETISSAQAYTWILYVIPAIGLFIVRILDINLIIGLYLAKLLNFIFFVIVGYYTIKKIPFGKILMAIYLMIPMVLQQATSFSADVMVNAVSLYIIAYIVYLLFKENAITNKELIVLCLLTCVLALAKYAYIPLIGIALLLIFKKNVTKKQKAIFLTIMLVLGIIFSLISYLDAGRYKTTAASMEEYYEEFNVNQSEQIQHIIQHPIGVIKTFAMDWITNMDMYIFMCLGSQLSWLNIHISTLIIGAYIILLILAPLMENHSYQFKKLEKVWIVLIGIGIMTLIQLAMYLSFTPVGANFIGGVQGRYFIPVFILPLLCICMKNNYIKLKNPELLFTITATILNIFVVSKIFINFI